MTVFFLSTSVSSKTINQISENVTCINRVGETRSIKEESLAAVIKIPIVELRNSYEFNSRVKLISEISKVDYKCLRNRNSAAAKKGRFGGGGRLSPAKWKKVKVTPLKQRDSKFELEVNFEFYIPPKNIKKFNEVVINLIFDPETNTLEVIESDQQKGLYVIYGDFQQIPVE